MRYDTIQRLRTITTPRKVMGKGQKSLFIGEPLQRMLDRTTLPLTTVVNTMADRLDRLSMPDGGLTDDDVSIIKAAGACVKASARAYTALEIETKIAIDMHNRGYVQQAVTFSKLPYAIKLAIVLQAERGGQ